MSICYATVDQLFDEQPSPNEDGVTTATKQKMLEYGFEVTGKFHQFLGYDFAPAIATKYRNVDQVWRNGRIQNDLLYLDEPLLATTSATLADGTALIENTDYRLEPRGVTPAYALRMISASYTWTAQSDASNDITITGVWGWHDDYANAWIDSANTISEALDTSETGITVTDSPGGATIQGLMPQFSPGNLIKIDNEYMTVIEVTISTNVLTVIRGSRGSTAATHDIGAAITVFKPTPAIIRAAKKQTAFDLARAGQFTRVSFDGVRVTSVPDILPEVEQILHSFSFLTLGGI